MLEWMHDPGVTNVLKKGFASMNLQDCKNFIVSCLDESTDIHRAIVNDYDEYMGTVSLKNVDKKNACAEFAIVIRSCAHGSGLAKKAIGEILEYAHNTLNLEIVYWNVLRKNERAIRFYEKNGFHRAEFDKICTMSNKSIGQNDPDLFWYYSTEKSENKTTL